MKIFRSLLLLAVGVVLALPVTKAADAPAAPGKLPVLGVAPAWKLKDVDGKEVSFAQFKGKVVVVGFLGDMVRPLQKHEIPGYVSPCRKSMARTAS